MKRIIVCNCQECPYVDFDVFPKVNEETKRAEGIVKFRCNQYIIANNEWTDGLNIPKECPLEDM